MDKVILNSTSTTDFVECSSKHVKTTGTLFKKQIFKWGEFSHPNNPNYKIKVDQKFYEDLKRNFDAGVCPIVQFPLANEQNQHVESPDKNIGQVLDMSSDEDGVNVFIDVRKLPEDIGKTILGASAKVALNYVDTRTNEKVGPTLLHVAATNRPYLVDLKDFETVSASMDDTSMEDVLLLTDGAQYTPKIQEEPMKKEELIEALSEYGVDVVAGQQALEQVAGYASLSNVLGDDVVATPEVLSNAIVELSSTVKERDDQITALDEQVEALSNTIKEVNLSAATEKVDGLIKAGRILPAAKEIMIELSMEDATKFETLLLPEEYAKAEMTELSSSTVQDPHKVSPEEAALEEGKRLAARANR